MQFFRVHSYVSGMKVELVPLILTFIYVFFISIRIVKYFFSIDDV